MLFHAPVDSIEVGIYLELPDSLKKKILSIQESFTKVDGKKIYRVNTPHISLGQGKFKKKDLPEIENALTTISKEFNQFPITVSPEPVIVGRNVFFKVKNTEALRRIEKSVMAVVAKYRSGIMQQYVADLEKNDLTKEEKEDISRVGVSNSGRFFNPHITAYYDMHDVESVKSVLRGNRLSQESLHFEAVSLGMGELGYFGNVEKPIQSYALSVKFSFTQIPSRL